MTADESGFEDYDIAVIQRRWSADYRLPLDTGKVFRTSRAITRRLTRVANLPELCWIFPPRASCVESFQQPVWRLSENV